MKIENSNNTTHTKELLPQIVERIFSICRTDPNFHLKDEMEIIGNKIESVNQKITKQNQLLEQSDILKKDIIQRIEIIDNENNNKQSELLELLGSEL